MKLFKKLPFVFVLMFSVLSQPSFGENSLKKEKTSYKSKVIFSALVFLGGGFLASKFIPVSTKQRDNPSPLADLDEDQSHFSMTSVQQDVSSDFGSDGLRNKAREFVRASNNLIKTVKEKNLDEALEELKEINKKYKDSEFFPMRLQLEYCVELLESTKSEDKLPGELNKLLKDLKEKKLALGELKDTDLTDDETQIKKFLSNSLKLSIESPDLNDWNKAVEMINNSRDPKQRALLISFILYYSIDYFETTGSSVQRMLTSYQKCGKVVDNMDSVLQVLDKIRLEELKEIKSLFHELIYKLGLFEDDVVNLEKHLAETEELVGQLSAGCDSGPLG